MTDALPSAQLGVAGSSLLCSGTDLTAPPLILIQTRFQGFSGRGDSSAMALVDSGTSITSCRLPWLSRWVGGLRRLPCVSALLTVKNCVLWAKLMAW